MIHATATLAPDTERDLAAAAQAGDASAMTTLVTAHVRYLRAEARKYAAAEPMLDAEDMLSAGLEAFLGAVATFDPARGVRLLTHARPSIALAMDEEKSGGRAISVPSRTLRRYRRALRENDSVEAARAAASSRDGRMGPELFDAVHFAMTGGVPLDSPNGDRPGQVGSGGDEFAGDVELQVSTDQPLLGARGQAPEATAVANDLASRALAVLTDDRHREVVALAYLSGEDLSDAAIADRLGMSRPTVTRVRNAALELMRGAVA